MATPVSDSVSKRGLWLNGALAVAVAGLGGGLTYVVMAPTPTERIQAALPPLPDLGSAVPQLRTKLSEAHARVQRSGQLSDLADYGRLLQANDFAAEAMQTWRLLLHEDPTEGRWPYYLAHLYRDAGDVGETTALLQATTDVAPDYSPAWLQLGDIAFKSGRFPVARAYYETRLDQEPGDPYARLGLARIDLQENRPAEAMAALLKLVADHPAFASAHNLLSRLYRDNGDEDRAEKHRWLGFQSGRFATADDPWIRELHPWCFTPEKLFVIGMVDFQTNRGDRGRTEYEKAVAVDPKNPGNHELLGDYYRTINEPDLAVTTLSQSLSLAEMQGSTPPLLSLVNLAAIKREQGDLAASQRIAKAGIAAHPQAPELWVELGLTLDALQQFDAAQEAYRSALKLSPHFTAAHFNLGELHLQAERIEPAMASFKAALVQQPTFAPALRYLLQYTLATNRLAEAGDYAATALQAYWGDPDVRQLVSLYHLRRGRAELAAGARQSAIKQFQRGFELHPQDEELALELGSLQLAQGNFRAALAPLETLLELRPNDPSAHLFLAQAHLMDGRTRRAIGLLENGLKLAEASGQTQTAALLQEMLGSVKR